MNTPIGIKYYSNVKIFVLVYSTGNVFRLALSRFFAYKFFALVQSYKLLLNRKIKEKHREIGGFCIRLINTKKHSVFLCNWYAIQAYSSYTLIDYLQYICCIKSVKFQTPNSEYLIFYAISVTYLMSLLNYFSLSIFCW